MKILMVSHEYPPIGGGGANACMNLAKGLQKLNHEVVVLTTWYPELPRYAEEKKLLIVRLPSRRKHLSHCSFGEMFSYLWLALKESVRMQKEKKFDVVMVFFAIPSGPVGYYLKKRFGVPYIIRFGGGDIPGFQNRFKLVYKFIGPFEKVIWKQAEALVANSKGLYKLAKHFYDKQAIKIIPNGVDVDVFQAESTDEKKKTYQILFVSRLIERKGLQFIIPQMKSLQEACDRKVMLTVVGDGPYRKVLENLAVDEGVAESVVFAGQKDKNELLYYYNMADVFILPSKKEGMPNVVLEAMASGLPIIMTPCEGSDELIDGNGYAVVAEQFGEKLALLEKDEELRAWMAQKSVELVHERFMWEAVVKQYEKILKDVCDD